MPGIGMGIGLWRSSGSQVTPKTLFGSNLALWLRADLGVTLDPTNVSAWADQSGNNRHATQSNASYRAAYTAANAYFNGKPSVDFDGANDFFDLVPVPQSLPMHAYAAMRNRNTTAIYRIFLNRSPAAAPALYSSITGNTNQMSAHWNGVDYTHVSADFTGPTAKDVVRYRLQSGTVGLRVNNAAELTVAHAETALGDFTTLSSGVGVQLLYAEIAEILIVTNLAISAAQDAAVMSYFSSRYA